MSYKKICQICGAEFESEAARALYCPECRHEAYLRKQKENYLERKKDNPSLAQQKAARKRQQKKLNKEIREADKSGASYGKWRIDKDNMLPKVVLPEWVK